MPPSATLEITPGFLLMQGNRLELLQQVLIDWLKQHPLAPLENETFLVQSNGMAQWLRLGLARPRAAQGGGLGIATGIEMILPARLQWQCYRAVLGTDYVPAEAPLDKDKLVWRLMRLLPNLIHTPPFLPLHHYVFTDQRPDDRRLYQLALRIADQFDQYQVYRADWLRHWQEGHDDLPAHEPPLPDEQRWQPPLWRALLEDIREQQAANGGGIKIAAGRADLHTAFRKAASEQPERPAGLPRRIVVFGLSSIAPQVLDVLAAASRWSQVIVCFLNPCEYYWGDIIDGHRLFAQHYQGQRPYKSAPDETTHAHPLLAAWGRQGRDLIRLLDQFEENPQLASNPLTLTPFESPLANVVAPSLLTLIQEDILKLRPPNELRDLNRRLEPDQDHSLQFHIAHSPLREVEILHDQLLAAFEADTSLKPTDIIVMVPDMSTYAPAISAIFGRFNRDDPHHIPFSISDQAAQGQVALINALEQMLNLPTSRLPRSELLDLLGSPLLLARFGISEADLPNLHDWIDSSGIRWGLDAPHRETFGVPPGMEQNTWAFGLKRLLLGYLSGDENAIWEGIEPHPVMDGIGAELVGKLAQLVARLDDYTRLLTENYTPTEWVLHLRQLMTDFFALTHAPNHVDTPELQIEMDTLERLHNELDLWLADCTAAGFEERLDIETVRHAWLNRLEPHRLHQRFIVGGVNFATLMPMRAIPYRHIYLLGMDDANYPRRQTPNDFDLMNGRYRPGDRARREDDRYLFLEALLAARERLSISWVGRNINNNKTRPASVLVSQLQDYLDQFWQVPEPYSCSEIQTTEHPLHPFSRRYFSADTTDLFTYANDWRAVHDRIQGTVNAALPIWLPEEPLALDALSDFLRAPAQTLLTARLGIYLRPPSTELEDHEPFELDGLQRWQLKKEINDRVRHQIATQARATGQTTAPTIAHISALISTQYHQARLGGRLPIVSPAFEHSELLPLIDQWQRWLELTQRFQQILPTPPVQRIQTDHGIMLEAAVSDVLSTDQNHAMARLIFIEGKLHRGQDIEWYKCVAQWPAHLLAQISHGAVETYLIGETGTLCFTPIEAAVAKQYLATLLNAWFDAVQAPYPLACKTAFCWLAQEGADTALNKARECYEGNMNIPGEVTNSPALARTWPDFTALNAGYSFSNAQFTELGQIIYTPIKQAIEPR
jgi:exodeoxyribonuclease V gamma subunit